MSTGDTVDIRIAKERDKLRCAEIYTDAWDIAHPNVPRQIDVAYFRRETEGELTLVATYLGVVEAYISIWEADWFIHHLYVDPAKHRAGLGSRLIKHASKLANTNPLSLKCQSANSSAIRFYQSQGFQITADRGQDEYGDWVGLKRFARVG